MNQPSSYRSAIGTSTLAVVSLVFGILTWLMLPFVGALVAIICGHLARGEIRRAGPGQLDGNGMAVAGLLLGYLHLAMVILGMLTLVTLFWLGFSLPFWLESAFR
jgi:hypothetical protein